MTHMIDEKEIKYFGINFETCSSTVTKEQWIDFSMRNLGRAVKNSGVIDNNKIYRAKLFIYELTVEE